LAGPCAPPADADADECLGEYRHLFSADILAGQVAFITGGGSGIGFRIAEIFMRHGCHTVIASRSLERVLQVILPFLEQQPLCRMWSCGLQISHDLRL
uniref:Peroxisomal 2,4-dienoyl-CoA reductase [(3E)-enoyl-CoA-producing] n=1 Tax=Nothoprocta perdicaria TaxID=30464 RepID=A0A8C6ZEN2_NOTPE